MFIFECITFFEFKWKQYGDKTKYRIHENTSIKNKTGINRRPDVWVEEISTGKVVKVYEAARASKKYGMAKREVAKVGQYIKGGIKYFFKIVK